MGSEAEERRKELLRRARQESGYGGNGFPAVHSRYRNAYRELYGGEQCAEKSTFYLRCMIAGLCFICFMWMEQEEVTVASVSSRKVVSQIEKQFDTKEIRAVWKKL